VSCLKDDSKACDNSSGGGGNNQHRHNAGNELRTSARRSLDMNHNKMLVTIHAFLTTRKM